jgi:AAA family ATP:ADP antiporter
MIKKFAYTLLPIKRNEVGRCISMGMMFFFILFNYDLLRALKDGLIVPNIDPRVVGFVKTYAITPSALSFMLFYTYISERLPFGTIFLYIAGFFLTFFLVFAFVLYPHQDFFHPNAQAINDLIKTKLHIFSWSIDMDHFKWFLKMYGKWSFVLFYVLAELWGSAMIFMLFWQFANRTTTTEDAKRLYPAYAFIAHFGAFFAGVVVEDLASLGDSRFITSCMLTASASTIATIILFEYNKRSADKHNKHLVASTKVAEYKYKLTVLESLKVIISSKYLWLIVVLVFAYGTSVNLIDGVWREKVLAFHKDTVSYSHFMGMTIKYTGIFAIVCMLIAGPMLRAFGWLFGALMLPVMMLITGLIFFLVAIFADDISPYLLSLGIKNTLLFVVAVGTLQNIFCRALKYSFFDITKEMTYIPSGEHLRSKGKAAVDVVGARWGKSLGSILQSTLFMVFPLATYTSLSPLLMLIYTVLILIWLVSVKKLYAAYTQKLAEHKAASY